MEFSGYCDSQGSDLYEEDIVAGFDALFVVRKGIVRIKKVAPDDSVNEVEVSCFYFEHEGLPLFPITNNYLGEHDLQTLTKVGNIYANPELLK